MTLVSKNHVLNKNVSQPFHQTLCSLGLLLFLFLTRLLLKKQGSPGFDMIVYWILRLHVYGFMHLQVSGLCVYGFSGLPFQLQQRWPSLQPRVRSQRPPEPPTAQGKLFCTECSGNEKICELFVLRVSTFSSIQIR